MDILAPIIPVLSVEEAAKFRLSMGSSKRLAKERKLFHRGSIGWSGMSFGFYETSIRNPQGVDASKMKSISPQIQHYCSNATGWNFAKSTNAL